MRSPIIATGFALVASAAMAQDPVLIVYTYDSFVSDWGPGPAVEAAFEETCGCDLQFVGAGDGAALLARLFLEGAQTGADVVLGLDTNLIASARAMDLIADHGVDASGLTLPISWDDPQFLPFDWGYFAFVHGTELENPPSNFRELAASDLRIVIQDPRSSTPGLGLLMWIKAAYGADAAAIWEGLADNIVTVTPGWSEAYGLYLEGEADMVLSYTTSPAYHIAAEDDLTKKAAIFPEGHYFMAELTAQLKATDQPELAQKFMDWILTPDFQKTIPLANWSLPAKLPEAEWPEVMRDLPSPEKTLFYTEDEAEALRKPALDEWLRAFSQ